MRLSREPGFPPRRTDVKFCREAKNILNSLFFVKDKAILFLDFFFLMIKWRNQILKIGSDLQNCPSQMVWIFVKRQSKTEHCDSISQKINPVTTQFVLYSKLCWCCRQTYMISHNTKILFVPIQKENHTIQQVNKTKHSNFLFPPFSPILINNLF